MRIILILSLFLAASSATAPAAGAEIERIELVQREDVILKHQRFVGNTRAQAKREGIITRVPQLYVYFTDQTAAWQLQGFREDFTRELALTFDHQRRERSMVRIDRLLERTITPQGKPIAPRDLPPADIYLFTYHRAGCEDCRRLDEKLNEWLDGRGDLEAVWLEVRLGPPGRE